MATSFHPPLTTKNSFLKTIQTDQLVFRWCLYLIRKPTVKDVLVKDSTGKSTYTQMERLLVVHRLLVLSVVAGVFMYMLGQSVYVMLSVGVLFVVSLLAEARLRSRVSQLAYILTGQFFNETEFERNTLYMLCEKLSEEYQIESLVYGVAAIDNVVRRLIIFAVFLVIFIKLMTFWNGLFTLLVLYYIGTVIVNTSVVYRALMK